MQMHWAGITEENYEQLRGEVNWEGNVPDGAVLHVASFGDNAIHVTDIWESAEDFNSFAETRLMPAVVAAGITSQPTVNFYPLHALFAPVFDYVEE
jgi:hypothetical protein